MKRMLVVAMVMAFAAHGEDIRTIDGAEYKGATISRVEPDGLVLATDSGIEKVSFSRLPKTLQEKHGYDPERAAEFAMEIKKAKEAARRQMQESADKERLRITQSLKRAEELNRRKVEQAEETERLRQRVAEEEEKRQSEKIKASVRTIKEVKTDLPGFYDRRIYIEGRIDVSSYYNWSFSNAQELFFSFRIEDKTGYIYVYMKREDGAGVRQQIIAAQEPLRGLFQIAIPSALYESQRIPEALGFLLSARSPLE